MVVSKLETIMGLLLAEGMGREEGEDGQPGGHGVCVCVLRDSRGREGRLLVSPSYCSRCSDLSFSEDHDVLPKGSLHWTRDTSLFFIFFENPK